uniref:Uncharacterized protein n=1 Tax=uncultured bacterium fosmid pJB39A3 TaxID=1478063 RepID=A0A0H3U9M0_9BACT|nr:hypothetical protein [uncultured bacterium fosmid pJB39A3]
MAAGSTSSLMICDTRDGEYKFTTKLKPFTGVLIPVSTDKIQNGFQHVTKFEYYEGREPSVLATVFDNAPDTEYYKTTLYLKSKGNPLDVYVSNIGYEDSDPRNPISSAIRVGLVVYKPGSETEIDNEYIFDINPEGEVEHPSYNTSTGTEGYVLNSATKDNTTIPFTPYTEENYCAIDEKTSEVIVTPGKSTQIATCPIGTEGKPVKVDVYIWLEGCDSNCVGDLLGATLKEASIEFAGKPQS